MTKVLLDTNILVRSVQRGDTMNGVAIDSLRTLEETGHDLCVVPQVLYELWVVLTRPVENNGVGYSLDEAKQEFVRLLSLFQLLRDERRVFSAWHELVTQHSVMGKKAHDARLVAAMIRHGVSRLLTFNGEDFTRYPSVTILHPADVVAQE